ncbi:MAG: hypothetical protein KGL39_11005, partial [Patescibacteria group bacterium]|nr:hypothetical protein [Patescibacteria group bacterium]
MSAHISGRLTRIVGCFLLAPWEASAFALIGRATSLTKRLEPKKRRYRNNNGDLSHEIPGPTAFSWPTWKTVASAAITEGRIDLFKALVASTPWPQMGNCPFEYLGAIEKFKGDALDLSWFFGMAARRDDIRAMALLRPSVSNLDMIHCLGDAAGKGHLKATKAILSWTDQDEYPIEFASECDSASERAASKGHLNVIKLLADESVLNASSAYYGIFNTIDNKRPKAKTRAIAHYLLHNFQDDI